MPENKLLVTDTHIECHIVIKRPYSNDEELVEGIRDTQELLKLTPKPVAQKQECNLSLSANSTS